MTKALASSSWPLASRMFQGRGSPRRTWLWTSFNNCMAHPSCAAPLLCAAALTTPCSPLALQQALASVRGNRSARLAKAATTSRGSERRRDGAAQVIRRGPPVGVAGWLGWQQLHVHGQPASAHDPPQRLQETGVAD